MTSLPELVAAELGEPVDPRVSAFAAHIAGEYGEAARAVLFYGSCLRSEQLDGEMLDFYLIVSDYRAAYAKRWLATANRLIPPNVFPANYDGLQAKIAVLSEADFLREVGDDARSVSVWARFAQPSRLVWAADEAARRDAIETVAQAAPTLFRHTLPMMDEADAADALAIWRRGFALTYSAELRAERKTRSGSIVDATPDRYARFGEAALAAIGDEAAKNPKRMARWWRSTRRKGKALTLLRLTKASATYAGGVDYLAWKINRHAGTDIRVKPWQRRWPLLGAVVLLPRLLIRGAVR